MGCVLKLKKKSSHVGHCTHTTGSINVNEQNISHRRNSITCSTNFTCRTSAGLYTLETRFVSGIQSVPGGMCQTSGECSLS